MLSYRLACITRNALMILGVIAIIAGIVLSLVSMFGNFTETISLGLYSQVTHTNNLLRGAYIAGAFYAIASGFILIMCAYATEFFSKRLDLDIFADVDAEDDTEYLPD